MADVYEVRSYHINVMAGDASIHLLLRNGSDGIKMVQSAILLDGGDVTKEMAEPNLRLTVGQIERDKLYDWSEAVPKGAVRGHKLRFNSVIVTHWHEDHYGGIVSLMQTGRSDLKGKPPIVFFYYSLSDEGGYLPLTTLYCPNIQAQKSKATDTKPNPKEILSGPSPALSFTSNKTVNFDAERKQGQKGKWLQDVLKYKHGDLRGINFFDGSRNDNVMAKSPTELVKASDEAPPGLYCIGSNSWVLGRERQVPWKSRLEEDHTAISHVPEVVESSSRDCTNHSCIVAMVIWPDEDRTVSHYLAGDAGWKIENAVEAWTQAGGPRTVKAMKLSHHGAASSTPFGLIKAFQPEKILVSAGFEYGHPRWELLLYLSAFYQKLDGDARKTKPTRPLYPTNYPYWFAVNQHADPFTKKQFEFVPYSARPDPLYPDAKGVYGTYQQLLKEAYAAINTQDPATALSEYEFFKTATDKNDPALKKQVSKQFISKICVPQWPELSPLNPLLSYWGTWPRFAARAKVVFPIPGLSNSPITYHMLVQAKAPKFNVEVLTYFQYYPDINLLEPTSTKIAYTAPISEGSVKKLAMAEGSLTVYSCALLDGPVSKDLIMGKELDDGAEESDPGEDTNDGEEMAKKKKTGHKLASKLINVPSEPRSEQAYVQGQHASKISMDSGFIFHKFDSPGPGTPITPEGSPLDLFVSSLDSGDIALTSAPTTHGVSFLPTDEMMTWFSAVFRIQAFTVSGDERTIDSFNVTMDFATGSIAFNSPSFFTAMGLQPPITIPSPNQKPPGIMGNSLILGLSAAFSPKSETLDMKFGALVSELYRENPDSVPTGLELFDDLQLTLDPDLKRSGGKRNALWFTPGTNYTTIQRLVFDVSDDSLPSSLLSALKISLSKVTVIAKKTSRYYGPAKQPSRIVDRSVSIVADQATLQIENPPGLTFALTFVNDKLEVLLQYEDTKQRLSPGFMLDWLLALVPGAFNKPNFSEMLHSDAIPGFRRANVTFAKDLHTNGLKVMSFGLSLDFQLDFGHVSGQVVTILFTLSWNRDSGLELRGSLWFATNPYAGLPDGMTKEMVPSYETYEELQPIDKSAADGLSLRYILPDGSPLSNMPIAIQEAKVTAVSIGVSGSEFNFTGCITGDSLNTINDPTINPAPTLTFNQLFLGANWVFSGHHPETSGSIDLFLGFKVSLTPSAGDLAAGYQTAVLSGRVEYNSTPSIENSSEWQLSASTTNLCLASLYEYFDPDCQDGVMSVLRTMYIQNLALNYEYASGTGSSFTFVGSILLDVLELDFTYDYPPKNRKTGQSDWSFSAGLTASPTISTSTKVDDIIQELCGKNIGLPKSVGQISISSAIKETSLSIKMKKVSDSKGKTLVFSAVELEIDQFALSFVQYVDTTQPKEVKRLVLASLSELPGADIPIVGEMEKFFDELYFLYLDDETASTGGGLTAEEVDLFNSNVDKTRLVPQLPKKGSNIVIQAGYHFTIIVNENNKPTAVLDYMFDNPDAKTQSLPGPPLELSKARDTVHGSYDSAVGVRILDNGPPENPPGLAPFHVTMGPLTISNIGLQYKSNTLSILVDASVQLGPIELILVGLGLGLDLSGDFTLGNLPSKLVPNLGGVAVSFNKPPVVMAGMFEYQDPLFLGGLTVTVDPYNFLAAGEYGIITVQDGTKDGTKFKTVSVFASLTGPLIEFAFAEVTGICGGFGYNSYLAFPTSETVPQFPFFNSKLIGEDPLQTMINMGSSNCITPTNRDYWLAAGLTVNAFQALSMEVVVVVEFDPTVKLGIFADCVSQVPDEGKFKLLYVELGIACTVDFAAGTMAIDGTLSPTSFILDPSCHLTGGFALYYWFGSNGHTGDWVFTVGGYHPAYKPQPYYPNPARVGISWNMDDGVTICGNAYFALTPNACMAGGCLNYNLGLGPLSAYFDAWADFLINFKPFYFIGDVGVDVGVRFTLDLWICTIHISVDINAAMHIEGPSVHGYVHVDFWLFGFDIYFGQDPVPPAAVDINSFYRLIYQSKEVPVTPVNDHILNVETGLMADESNSDPKVPEKHDWNVHANTFSFSLGLVAPVSELHVSNIVPDPEVSHAVFYSRPMQLKHPMKSELTVCISRDGDPTDLFAFGVIQNVKKVPRAVWDQYSESNDPSHPNLQNPNQISSLLDGKTDPSLPVVMSLTLTAPPATLAPDKFLAYNAIERNKELLDEQNFPQIKRSERVWLPDKPASDISVQYADVESHWNNPSFGTGAAQTAAQIWSRAFGWVDKPPPKQQQQKHDGGKKHGRRVRDPSVLVMQARPPKNLVGSLDQFYLSPPVINVS